MTRARTDTIEIPGLDVAKAKRYSRIKLGILLGSTLWTIARAAWFATDRRAVRFKDSIDQELPNKRLVTPVFFALITALSWLTSLPISYLSGHVVERRFGLTKQSTTSWVGEKVKELLLEIVLQTPLLTAAFAVIRRRPRDWWLILSGASVPLVVVLSTLAPVLLMPLFNRFQVLRNTALEVRIRALAERSGVQISEVYEMDMSRQSEKPNAMFTGIGKTKRIVLGDTLLSAFPDDEIEAVVAHEMGHQVHGDIWRQIGFGTGAGFGIAWLLFRISSPVIRKTTRKTGVTSVDDAASLPILALLLTAIGFIFMPIQAAFSRALERRADRYALQLTQNGEAYASAMERLAVQSLADPNPPKPVVLMLYSHPPIIERIRAARETEWRS